MKPSQARELQTRFRQHHSLVTRAELRLLGVTYGQERSRVQAGEWEVAAPGVLRLAGSVRTPEQALLAACLGAGSSGVASHQSAAWMWDLLERAPDRHAVTVARGVSGAWPASTSTDRSTIPPMWLRCGRFPARTRCAAWSIWPR